MLVSEDSIAASTCQSGSASQYITHLRQLQHRALGTLLQCFGIQPHTNEFTHRINMFRTQISFHKFLDVNEKEVESSVQGLVDKLSIHVMYSKSRQLQALWTKLKLICAEEPADFVRSYVGQEQFPFRAMSLLLLLSGSPTSSMGDHGTHPSSSLHTEPQVEIEATSVGAAELEILQREWLAEFEETSTSSWGSDDSLDESESSLDPTEDDAAGSCIQEIPDPALQSETEPFNEEEVGCNPHSINWKDVCGQGLSLSARSVSRFTTPPSAISPLTIDTWSSFFTTYAVKFESKKTDNGHNVVEEEHVAVHVLQMIRGRSNDLFEMTTNPAMVNWERQQSARDSVTRPDHTIKVSRQAPCQITVRKYPCYAVRDLSKGALTSILNRFAQCGESILCTRKLLSVFADALDSGNTIIGTVVEAFLNEVRCILQAFDNCVCRWENDLRVEMNGSERLTLMSLLHEVLPWSNMFTDINEHLLAYWSQRGSCRRATAILINSLFYSLQEKSLMGLESGQDPQVSMPNAEVGTLNELTGINILHHRISEPMQNWRTRLLIICMRWYLHRLFLDTGMFKSLDTRQSVETFVLTQGEAWDKSVENWGDQAVDVSAIPIPFEQAAEKIVKSGKDMRILRRFEQRYSHGGSR